MPVDPRPLILTLALDPETFAVLDALRRRHFPPDRLVVAAHVTLFHALPGDRADAVAVDVAAVAAETPAFAVRFPGVRFLGRGVAVEVASPDLKQVRQTLVERWWDWLGPQDRQPHRPHVTVQNKVDPPTARALYERLRADWEPITGRGIGLSLWRYAGGPWERVGTVPFRVG
jgi:2'-5' RNA ligase